MKMKTFSNFNFKTKAIEFGNKNKDVIKCLVMVGLVMFLTSSEIFAEDTIAVLDKAGDQIIKLITAKWVKALLTVALVIEFGVCAFGNAQGEGGMVKKVLPWIIGTAGILGSTSIVKFFFTNIEASGL